MSISSKNPSHTSSLFGGEPSSASATFINAHCDGGARGNPGPAGYGAVIADSHGHILAQLSEYLGHRTNNFAEYSGLLGCLQWTLDHKHRNLRVVSDSELMVKQIQGKYKVNSPDLRPLWQEARNRIAQLDRFEITHALRHKNKDADRLANEAMDRGTGKSPTKNPGAPDLSHLEIGVSTKPSGKTPTTTSPTKNPGPMIRGFTRDGTIHLLGDARLPDGIFVKVIPE